jgi:NADH:ubiquinone oxidoreductase subunit 4 (subunit M)
MSDDPHFHHLPDAKGPEWAALGILVFVLVLFGVAPSIAIGPVDTATAPLLQRVRPAASTQLETGNPIPR